MNQCVSEARRRVPARTSAGFALPGVVAGHLAVASLRQGAVKTALRLTVKVGILKRDGQRPRVPGVKALPFLRRRYNHCCCRLTVPVCAALTKCRPSPASSSCPVGLQVSSLKRSWYELKSPLSLGTHASRERSLWKVSTLVNGQVWVARLGHPERLHGSAERSVTGS